MKTDIKEQMMKKSSLFRLKPSSLKNLIQGVKILFFIIFSSSLLYGATQITVGERF